MKDLEKTLIRLCLAAVVMMLWTGVGFAQTADGVTPAEETVCDELSGAAFGLCNAYCEAMDCELLDDGDNTTFPNASETACLEVKANFIKIAGGVPPCDCPDLGPGQAGCACTADSDCLGDLVCSNTTGGICEEDDSDPPNGES